MVLGVNPSYILIVQKKGERMKSEVVPTIINNCHIASFIFASFSACFRKSDDLVVCLFTREICYGSFDGNSAWSTFHASHYPRIERRRLSPSGVGVCDRVAVNKELEG